MQIALDANILIGLMDSQDIWHAKATALYTAIKSMGAEEIISDCCLTEALSVIGRRLHEKGRSADWNSIFQRVLNDYPPERLTWILPDCPRLYREVTDLMFRSNAELNFNDALLAVSCRERKVILLASFDHDFDQIDWLTRIERPADLSEFK